MVSPARIRIGDEVTDRILGLDWRVVNIDDDGTTYIERNGIRSFTAMVNLWRKVSPGESQNNGQ